MCQIWHIGQVKVIQCGGNDIAFHPRKDMKPDWWAQVSNTFKRFLDKIGPSVNVKIMPVYWPTLWKYGTWTHSCGSVSVDVIWNWKREKALLMASIWRIIATRNFCRKPYVFLNRKHWAFYLHFFEFEKFEITLPVVYFVAVIHLSCSTSLIHKQ